MILNQILTKILLVPKVVILNLMLSLRFMLIFALVHALTIPYAVTMYKRWALSIIGITRNGIKLYESQGRHIEPNVVTALKTHVNDLWAIKYCQLEVTLTGNNHFINNEL